MKAATSPHQPKRRSVRAALPALCLATLGPVAAAQDDPDAPLTLEELRAKIDEALDAQKKSPVTGSDRATMKLFGRTHLDFWDFTDSDDAINVFESGDPSIDPRNNIEFRRARFGFSGDINDGMLYKTELDFGKPDGLVFKDMYFGFKDLPGVHKLLIGNQKRPYGLDHLNSSRFNVFIERPFVVEALNQDARRLGIASYGLSEDKAWNWRWGVYNLDDWSKTGEFVSDTLQPEITGRLAHTAWYDEESGGREYGHFAISGSHAWPDGDPSAGDANNEARFRTRPEGRSQSRWIDTGAIDYAENYTLVGLEGVANWNQTQVVSEFMSTWVSRGMGMEDLNFWGGYIQVAHFLTDDFMPWERKSGTLGRIKPTTNLGENGWGAFQVAARYSVADFSNKDIYGGVGRSVTLGFNWYMNPNASLQLNYIRGTISDRMETFAGSTFDEGDYDLIGIRFRVDF